MQNNNFGYQPKELDWSKYQDGSDYDEFKKDAMEACQIADHLKGELVFSRAWEYGHHRGYFQVFCILQDLALIIKE